MTARLPNIQMVRICPNAVETNKTRRVLVFCWRVKGCLRRARTLPVHGGETVKEGRGGLNVLPVMDADGGWGGGGSRTHRSRGPHVTQYSPDQTLLQFLRKVTNSDSGGGCPETFLEANPDV